MLGLMVALTAATVIVLVDSGLRLWFALGGIKAQHAAIRTGAADRLQLSMRAATRHTMRVSFARSRVMPGAQLRAAA